MKRSETTYIYKDKDGNVTRKSTVTVEEFDPEPRPIKSSSTPSTSSSSSKTPIIILAVCALLVVGVVFFVLPNMVMGGSSSESSKSAESVKPAGMDKAEVMQKYPDALYPAEDAATGKIGYISADGNWVIQPQLSQWSVFEDGLALQKDDNSGLWGYVDKTGKWAIEPQWQEAGAFHDGRAWVKVDFWYAYIDTTGAVVIPGPFYACSDFGEGLAWVVVGSDWSSADHGECFEIIDSSGNVIVENTEISYSNTVPGAFHDGRSVVRWASAYALVDTSGKFVADAVFKDATAFDGGLAGVRFADSGFWGYIDPNGQTVIPGQYQSATSFQDGYARVDDGKSYSYITPSGEVSLTGFEGGSLFNGGLVAALDSKGQLGLYDTEGNLVTAMDGGIDGLLTYGEAVYAK